MTLAAPSSNTSKTRTLKHNKFAVLLTPLFSAALSAAPSLPNIQVHGLLPPNRAVVVINGTQSVLSVGKTRAEALTLLSLDSKKAVFEWQGQRFERHLSQQISTNYSALSEKERKKISEIGGNNEVARIKRGASGHFLTQGQINGKPVEFLVDTGASSVAMSEKEADRLALNWHKGKPLTAKTASGDAAYYEVQLESVTVGGITIDNIQASVLMTGSVHPILLGASFLRQTEMAEKDGVMVLRKKH